MAALQCGQSGTLTSELCCEYQETSVVIIQKRVAHALVRWHLEIRCWNHRNTLRVLIKGPTTPSFQRGRGQAHVWLEWLRPVCHCISTTSSASHKYSVLSELLLVWTPIESSCWHWPRGFCSSFVPKVSKVPLTFYMVLKQELLQAPIQVLLKKEASPFGSFWPIWCLLTKMAPFLTFP